MLLEEFIKVKITKRNIDWYRGRGYDTDLGNEIFIKNSDLTIGSHFKIKAICDVCNIQKEMKYKTYRIHTKYDNNYYCSKCSILKREKICIERYGVKNYVQTEEFKTKSKETCKEKYGEEFYQKTKDYVKKIKETCKEKYGVNNVMQSKEIFQKQLSSAFKSYKFKKVTYQGEYELDFLKKYYDIISIEDGPSINYKLNGDDKVYHSDFYLPEYNLIVEIKSNYTYDYDLSMNLKKQEYSIKNGYNFLFIIDMKYDELNYLIQR